MEISRKAVVTASHKRDPMAGGTCGSGSCDELWMTAWSPPTPGAPRPACGAGTWPPSPARATAGMRAVIMPPARGARPRVAPGKARAGTRQRDEAGDDAAEQRQED